MCKCSSILKKEIGQEVELDNSQVLSNYLVKILDTKNTF